MIPNLEYLKIWYIDSRSMKMSLKKEEVVIAQANQYKYKRRYGRGNFLDHDSKQKPSS